MEKIIEKIVFSNQATEQKIIYLLHFFKHQNEFDSKINFLNILSEKIFFQNEVRIKNKNHL